MIGLQRTLTFAVALALLCCLSCSKTPSGNEASVPVSISMAVQDSPVEAFQVQTVRLTVYADDIQDMISDLQVVKGKVSTTLDVPPGPDRIFKMEARGSGERVLYAGADTVTIGQGLDQEVNVILRPVGLMLRTSPMYQEVSSGSQGQFDVYVFNVDSLFGASFRIYYDPAMIRIDGSSAGDFLGSGSDIIYFARLEEDTEAGYYAIAITRKGTDGTGVGVSGFGKLATVSFTALVPGTTAISLGVEADYALSKPDGSAVDRIAELVLDGSTIVVRGVAR